MNVVYEQRNQSDQKAQLIRGVGVKPELSLQNQAPSFSLVAARKEMVSDGKC